MAFNRTTVSGASALSGTTQPIVEDLFPHQQDGDQQQGGQGFETTGVPKSVTSEVTDSVNQEGQPKWATLERKETRLRADQLADLTELRRRISAQRTEKSEIITDNTLIRLAVDFLLTQGVGRLKGNTEEQLRKSLTRKPRARQAAPESASERVSAEGK
ncbi:hypothetical protein [Streptomyces lavendulae]|uniref:hypothetical protein n=1 Tax=Streptomyces lavendulae TaxID=1914 RepID=UPI0024A1F63F|nr:hypothetical protein [Streptomyces lavendulae]GLW04793.1 hypothetical protein Slala05_84230 [Streptomyces lavendulae subsp. lavendulae]